MSKTKLSEQEIETGAEMFTMENLGCSIDTRTVQGIHDQWLQFRENAYGDGVDLTGEHEDWLKRFRKGHKDTIKMWEKERTTIEGLRKETK